MTKVYIVTRGEYSDYRIISVWKKEADAKIVASSVWGDVETWTLNGNVDEVGLHFFFRVSQSGEVVEMEEHGYEPYPCKVGKKDIRGNWILTVQAENVDKARKIAFDQIGQYKAEQQGVADAAT